MEGKREREREIYIERVCVCVKKGSEKSWRETKGDTEKINQNALLGEVGKQFFSFNKEQKTKIRTKNNPPSTPNME